uniref:Uncharacterized protein n=1 Tax=Arundo donax TaxID=35708 RepID=A0A0A8YYY2_ARUDO
MLSVYRTGSLWLNHGPLHACIYCGVSLQNGNSTTRVLG